MGKYLKSSLIPLLMLALASAPALAQVTLRSTILGTVTDIQKAVVPVAEVQLKNLDTGGTWKAQTGQSGEYVFSNLIAGRYQVEITKQGFKKSLSAPTSLENGTTQRIDISLEVGEVSQQVEVTAAAPLVHTDDANVDLVIENRLVQDMPIQGRNFLNYAVLTPMFNSGTGDNSRADWGLASATAPGSKVYNLGGTEYGVGYYIDGINSNDNWVEGPTTNVNMDAVQEVKTEVVNYSAEYGRDVGQMSLTTKSGTNNLHGSVYDYRQVNGLNARDPYSKYEDPTRGRDPGHQDQYGFTVGGPVYIPRVLDLRNKLFFFASMERLRRRGQDTYLTYVPTDRERNGDFGEWLDRFPGEPSMIIYDPATFDPATQERRPYLNNIITNVNPKAVAYASHFPLPNYGSGNPEDIRNYKGQATTGINNNNWNLRFDYYLTQKDQIFFKYSRDNGQKLYENGVIPELTLGSGPVHNVDIFNGNWVRTFNPTFSNELKFSYMRAKNMSEDSKVINNFMTVDWYRNLFQNITTPGAGLSDYDKQQLGVQDDGVFATNIGTYDTGKLSDQLNGLSLGPGEYWYQAIPQWQISDSAIKVYKKHTFKMGFHHFGRDERDNDIIRTVGFTGFYTGRGPFIEDGSGWNNLAEFMTGTVTDMTQRTYIKNGSDASLWFTMPEWAAYFNDTWQFSPKLTVNLGVRYELAPQAWSTNSYWAVLDKTYPGWRMVMPGTTPGTQAKPFPADKNNFAPRFGLAYRVNDKWVARGGYGIFYETGRYKFMDQMFFNSPGYGGSQYSSSDYSAINGNDPNAVYFTMNNTFPEAQGVVKGEWPIPLGDLGGILYPRMDTPTIDADTPTTSYLQRWSLDVERELTPSMMVSLGYVGSKGTKLVIADDMNLPQQGVYLTGDDFQQARPLCLQNAAYCDRFGYVWGIHKNGNDAYHAFTVKFDKRFSHGLSILSHYTWSKQTDIVFLNNGYNNVSVIGGQWHRDWSHSASDADHPHRFVAAITYELPFGNTMKSGWVKRLVGDWQINSITTFETGSPVSVTNGDTTSHDYMGDVSSRLGDGNLPGGDRTFTRYFDTGAFVNPPDANGDGIADYRGNAGRNIIRLPGINNWDISLFKKILIRENQNIEFRWEMFNAFNHTQWSGVNTYNDTATNPLSTFGQINAGRPGRYIQFALKYIF